MSINMVIPAESTNKQTAVTEERKMSSTEKGVRTGVGIAHSIGSMALSFMGMGMFAKPIGELEQTIIGASFNVEDK